MPLPYLFIPHFCIFSKSLSLSLSPQNSLKDHGSIILPHPHWRQHQPHPLDGLKVAQRASYTPLQASTTPILWRIGQNNEFSKFPLFQSFPLILHFNMFLALKMIELCCGKGLDEKLRLGKG